MTRHVLRSRWQTGFLILLLLWMTLFAFNFPGKCERIKISTLIILYVLVKLNAIVERMFYFTWSAHPIVWAIQLPSIYDARIATWNNGTEEISGFFNGRRNNHKITAEAAPGLFYYAEVALFAHQKA